MTDRFLTAVRPANLVALAVLIAGSLVLANVAGLSGHVAWAAEDEAVELELPEEEPAPAPAAAAPSADTAAVEPAQSYLGWLFESLGWMYSLAFLAVSFVFVGLVVMHILSLRRDNFVPAALVEGFENHLAEKRYQDAYELAKNDDSFLGHVLAAGMAKLSSGYDQAVTAMQEVGEEENMKFEQRLSYIGLVGQISPMLGLLGTVDGMVASFNVIATSQTTPKPSELADGISMALVTTLIGLYIAIPAIAVFNIFRNRLNRLVLEVGMASEGLMGRFANPGKKA
jgi:biopolymer transport protein ExbB